MRAIAVSVLAVALMALPSHADTPWNDSPKNAVVVSEFPATITADTNGATTGLNEQGCASAYGAGLPARAVWYRIDLPAGVEEIVIRHAGVADVVMWSSGLRVTPDAEVMNRWGCVYAESDYPQWVGWGSAFYLSVAAPLTDDIPAAEITLEIPSQMRPPNDVPYRATTIPSLPYETAVDTRHATFDADADGCSQGAYVWYRYTPAAGRRVEARVSPVDGAYGATVSVYALGPDEVRTLGCDGLSWGTGDAVVTTDVEADVPVLIGVGDWGTYTLSLREVQPETGADDRAAAADLGVGDQTSYDTGAATLEPGEPDGCGTGGSVWFALPELPRTVVAEVTGGASVAAVAGSSIVACSTSGALTLDPSVGATHLQVRAPAARGIVSLRFVTPYGTPISGASPFPSGCDDATGSNARGSEVEVHHAVDPNDPDHIVTTWQQDRFRSGGGANGIGAAVTFDGGSTWTTTTLPGTSRCAGNNAFARATDPWAAVDADGTAYVMSLAFNPLPVEPANLSNALLLSRSEDGGLTWEDPIVVAASPGGVFHDKETLTADPNTPGLLYAVWDAWPSNAILPVFSRSSDGGRTWSAPLPLPTTGSGAGDQIAVLDDGTLVEIAPREHMQSITSRDGGATWSAVSRIGPRGEYEGPPGVRGGAYIPSVATDGTTVYVSWSDIFFTYVATSDDAGTTWDLHVLGADSPQTSYRSTTAVAVTGNGSIAVATYTVDDALRSMLTLAVSHDGGRTWTERPVTDHWDMRRAPYTVRGYFLGDYFAISGVSENEVLITYAAVPPGTAENISDIYTLRLTV